MRCSPTRAPPVSGTHSDVRRKVSPNLLLVAAALACAHAPQIKPPPAAPPVAQAPQAPSPVSPDVLHRQGREAIAQGNWSAAREKLEEYLAQEPADPAASFEAGWVCEQLGDREAAAGHYRRAAPRDARGALNLARLLPADSAEEVLRAALQEHPSDPRLLDALSGALRARKRLDEAEAAARKVLERHPRDAGAWKNLAAVEADRGRLRLSEAAYGNARKLDAKDPAIPNALGLLAIRRDDVNAARAWFEEATRVDPSFAVAWANLGALALRYRDYAAAERALDKALQLDPGRTESRLARAWALEGLHRPAEARAEYEKVLAADPRHDDASYGRALALKAEGDLAAAAAALRHYLDLQGTAHRKEAVQQLAAIDLRLRSAAKAVPDGAAQAGLSTPAQGDAADGHAVR